MSNLLKKQTESGVIPFGFPVMDAPNEPGDPGADSDAGTDNGPAADPEAAYRKKLLELERRSQEIERESYAKGFAQGEKDGLEYGQKTVQVVKTQLERIAENLENFPTRLCLEYRSWFISTCLKVARRVVRRELSVSPDIVADIAGALLDEAAEHSSLTAYLNPLDIEFMEKRAELVLDGRSKRFSIKADSNLERGGCRIESEIQLMDASIESQFEALEEYLQGQRAPELTPEVMTDGGE